MIAEERIKQIFEGENPRVQDLNDFIEYFNMFIPKCQPRELYLKAADMIRQIYTLDDARRAVNDVSDRSKTLFLIRSTVDREGAARIAYEKVMKLRNPDLAFSGKKVAPLIGVAGPQAEQGAPKIQWVSTLPEAQFLVDYLTARNEEDLIRYCLSGADGKNRQELLVIFDKSGLLSIVRNDLKLVDMLHVIGNAIIEETRPTFSALDFNTQRVIRELLVKIRDKDHFTRLCMRYNVDSIKELYSLTGIPYISYKVKKELCEDLYVKLDPVFRRLFPHLAAAQPSFAAAQPAFAAAQPSFAAAQPSFAAAQPSFAAAQPSFAAAQPSFAAAQPSFAAAPQRVVRRVELDDDDDEEDIILVRAGKPQDIRGSPVSVNISSTKKDEQLQCIKASEADVRHADDEDIIIRKQGGVSMANDTEVMICRPPYSQAPAAIPVRRELPSLPASPVRRPVSPIQRPVSPIQRPVSPIQRPVSPIQRPVSPIQRPVSPPRRPVSPPRRPASPIQRPASPIQRPVSPIQRPVSPIQRPVSPIQRPVSPMMAAQPIPPRPVSPVRRPVSPIQRPAASPPVIRRPVSPVRAPSPVMIPKSIPPSPRRSISPVRLPEQQPVMPPLRLPSPQAGDSSAFFKRLSGVPVPKSCGNLMSSEFNCDASEECMVKDVTNPSANVCVPKTKTITIEGRTYTGLASQIERLQRLIDEQRSVQRSRLRPMVLPDQEPEETTREDESDEEDRDILDDSEEEEEDVDIQIKRSAPVEVIPAPGIANLFGASSFQDRLRSQSEENRKVSQELSAECDRELVASRSRIQAAIDSTRKQIQASDIKKKLSVPQAPKKPRLLDIIEEEDDDERLKQEQIEKIAALARRKAEEKKAREEALRRAEEQARLKEEEELELARRREVERIAIARRKADLEEAARRKAEEEEEERELEELERRRERDRIASLARRKEEELRREREEKERERAEQEREERELEELERRRERDRIASLARRKAEEEERRRQREREEREAIARQQEEREREETERREQERLARRKAEDEERRRAERERAERERAERERAERERAERERAEREQEAIARQQEEERRRQREREEREERELEELERRREAERAIARRKAEEEEIRRQEERGRRQEEEDEKLFEIEAERRKKKFLDDQRIAMEAREARLAEMHIYQPPEVIFKGVVPDLRLKPSSRVVTDYKQTDLIPFKKISLSQLARQALETAQE
jgi:hypothetical protein